ncbi:MAG: NADH-quinone oxidoreductase subunit K [Microthrixaceae bacterium]
MSLLLASCAAVLASVGTYLVLQRKLSRIVVGIAMLSHAASVLWLTAGRRGDPPIVDGDVGGLSDPLPQAFALTAIVITFGITAFVLALAYRSWELTDDDEVEHDVADIEIRSRWRSPVETPSDVVIAEGDGERT